MTYSVAVIGAGPDPDTSVSGQSFSMGYRHAQGYEALENCELVAVADIVEENAIAFANTFDIDDDGIFEDHNRLLDVIQPDIVSIAVPPAGHAPLTIDCAQAGVEAIHCEKPMAETWAKSQRMAQVCWRNDVQLTFNHQLRCHAVTRRTKELLDEGKIGELERIELSRKNLYDAGSHQIDLANFFVDDESARWVIGQIDYREENRMFGVHNSNQGLAQWRYDNGVHALAATGYGADMVGCSHRLLGTEGRLEISFFDGGPQIECHSGGTVETIEVEANDSLLAAVEHVVDSLENGTEPILSARKVLNATELIFGTYESARKRGRVEFPLTIEDNPLTTMAEAGELEVDLDLE